jgi:hypothetical protein
MIRGWLERPAVHPVTMDGEAKSRIRLPPVCVKRVSFKPEFFIKQRCGGRTLRFREVHLRCTQLDSVALG